MPVSRSARNGGRKGKINVSNTSEFSNGSSDTNKLYNGSSDKNGHHNILNGNSDFIPANGGVELPRKATTDFDMLDIIGGSIGENISFIQKSILESPPVSSISQSLENLKIRELHQIPEVSESRTGSPVDTVASGSTETESVSKKRRKRYKKRKSKSARTNKSLPNTNENEGNNRNADGNNGHMNDQFPNGYYIINEPDSDMTALNEWSNLNEANMTYINDDSYCNFETEPFTMLNSEQTFLVEISINSKEIGRFIGKKGLFIKRISKKIRTTLQQHPSEKDCKLITLFGTENQYREASAMMLNLYPESEFPHTNKSINEATLYPYVEQCLEILPFTIGQTYSVIVTSVTSATDFSVKIPSLNHKFQRDEGIRLKMHEFYANNETVGVPFPCNHGTMCVGKVKGEFIRCQVLNSYLINEFNEETNMMIEKKKFRVLANDKGGIYEIDWHNLRQMKRSLFKMSAAAQRCFLKDLIPNEDYFDSGASYLCQMAEIHPMTMKIIEVNSFKEPLVELFFEENGVLINLNTELKRLNLATPAYQSISVAEPEDRSAQVRLATPVQSSRNESGLPVNES